jgi:predicted Rossmann fold nucleotide-binding protein DprA/Smf involved in DNA uptake
METTIKEHIGNFTLLEIKKTAFLCSRKIPAETVLKCYDWAIQQREEGNCIISGFHSPIEKDVLHYLLKGNQPIIVVLARGLKEKLEKEFTEPLEKGRLLIVTPFENNVKRVTKKTAEKRNKMMIELADEIVVGFLNTGGKLEDILKLESKKITKISV